MRSESEEGRSGVNQADQTEHHEMTDEHFGSCSDAGCQTPDTVINCMLENLPLLCQVISTQILRESVSVPKPSYKVDLCE